ncbi:DNA-binding protein [Neisseria gonorrhoeae]|uniref:DNA-binding protein n=1 Tax=Neisseria gonorrhoeae TaxID=485 RepID=A0A378VZA2_NEIGO|nr:DNA-binding protein [Neisseria gonorrhoeae]
MRLTTKGRFAVTAMLDLAMNAQTGAVKLSAISERQNISLSYLEQLFGKLRRAGLVESLRGPGGGYILAALPHKSTSPKSFPPPKTVWTRPNAAAKPTATTARPA